MYRKIMIDIVADRNKVHRYGMNDGAFVMNVCVGMEIECDAS